MNEGISRRSLFSICGGIATSALAVVTGKRPKHRRRTSGVVGLGQLAAQVRSAGFRWPKDAMAFLNKGLYVPGFAPKPWKSYWGEVERRACEKEFGGEVGG